MNKNMNLVDTHCKTSFLVKYVKSYQQKNTVRLKNHYGINKWRILA